MSVKGDVVNEELTEEFPLKNVLKKPNGKTLQLAVSPKVDKGPSNYIYTHP